MEFLVFYWNFRRKGFKIVGFVTKSLKDTNYLFQSHRVRFVNVALCLVFNRDTARVLAMEALGHEVRCISKVSTPGESDSESSRRCD